MTDSKDDSGNHQIVPSGRRELVRRSDALAARGLRDLASTERSQLLQQVGRMVLDGYGLQGGDAAIHGMIGSAYQATRAGKMAEDAFHAQLQTLLDSGTLQRKNAPPPPPPPPPPAPPKKPPAPPPAPPPPPTRQVHNCWLGGKVTLVLPPLPPEYRGQSGTSFHKFVFDPRVGEEVMLVILDDPDFSLQLGRVKPFSLFARTGVARTSAGSIAFIIWSISGPQGHVVDYEHTLNPFNIDTIRLLTDAARQTHLKVVVVDSYSGETVGFFELKNVFEFDGFATGLGQAIGHERAADFAATQAALREEFTLEELKRS